MFASNLVYIRNNTSESNRQHLSEMRDCIYRQYRSSDTSTSDSKCWLLLSCVSKGCVFLYFCVDTLFIQNKCV